MTDEIYWAAMHKIWENMKQSGRILRELQENITGEMLWRASAEQLESFASILPEEYRQRLLVERRRYDLNKIEAYLTSQHIHMMLYKDAAYPVQLKEIHQPPAILYYKGNFIDEPLQIGMVGSRKADRYGLETAEKIASQFSSANIPVVSGLARGIDAASHKGAIQYEGGTIAVQGCGIDRVYPKENIKLAEEILSHDKGCIISEFPIGSEPAAWHFPMRNRIISGLAQGVVIVQAARKSGAYITVETALEQGRDVFAVPGQIDNPLSDGPHQLIKEGAQMITCAQEVLESYGYKQTISEKNKHTSKAAEHHTANKAVNANVKTKKAEEKQMSLFPQEASKPDIVLSAQEELVLNLFTAEPLSIEEATYLSKLPVSELIAVLSMLELYGLIEPMVGRKYIRIG